MTARSSINDMPRNVSLGHKDTFGIQPFENGLTQFIQTTSTPITIALQGEWGSGKTSLMFSLKNNLCASDDSVYNSVWLNTWEYSLMNDAQSTLLQIILKLIQEVTSIANVNKSQTQKLLNQAANIGRGLARFGIKVAGDKIIEGAGDAVADQLFTETGESTVNEIRNELEAIIEECLVDSNKRGFIFFIDDLDRIDPPIAVNLLELLKNIFTIKNCIFILAIDYDVVVKGLEPKFGKLTDTNEREFRSFFDKIIQVPFSMPVNSYEVREFLKDSLVETGYISTEYAEKSQLLIAFTNIANLTVGSNPRALKRLLNALSLIGCINRAISNVDVLKDDLELIVNFALVSIQIAYPPIYRLLSQYPAFNSWDEVVALQMNLVDLSETEKEKLNKTEEFDEEWEQILYRFCEKDPYLKQKALVISKLLNQLKVIIQDEEEDISNIVESVITLSNVTSLDNVDQPIIDFHQGSLLKDIRHKLIEQLHRDFPQRASDIQPRGKRVQTNAYFDYADEKSIRITTFFDKEQIIIHLETSIWMFETVSSDLEGDIVGYKMTSQFKELEASYLQFMSNHPKFDFSKIVEHVRKLEGHHVMVLKSFLKLDSIAQCTSTTVIQSLSQMVGDWIPLLERLWAFSESINSLESKED